MIPSIFDGFISLTFLCLNLLVVYLGVKFWSFKKVAFWSNFDLEARRRKTNQFVG